MTYLDKYWHCLVQLRGATGRDYAVENDLTFSELERRIVTPWHKGAPFPVAGKVVTDRADVETIKIAHTPQPQQVYGDEHDARMQASGIADMATDRRRIPLNRGKDYTHELLFETLAARAPEPDVGLILRLCERVPRAAQILGSRQRGKAAFVVSDEYDVQDLLHALLRAYLKYTVSEEPLGKVAGAKSGRPDVAIEDLGVLIEAKYVRGPQDQTRLVEEFAQDLLLYSKWAALKHFVYLCYNSSDLRDPEALEKLEGEQNVGGRQFRVYVVLA
jgi:hypothetical protein